MQACNDRMCICSLTMLAANLLNHLQPTQLHVRVIMHQVQYAYTADTACPMAGTLYCPAYTLQCPACH